MKIEKPQPQETIGKYPVIREIGSGATSHVYLARDTFAERDVAIKVLDFARGVDALQVLAERLPDVMLLDIEMPRMDGFELTKTMKNDAKYAHVPIIVITSRTADKHRARAAELGVDLYLGKPFQEEELLRHLREMVGVSARA